MESCVKKVMAQGHSKDSAIGICHKSVVGSGGGKRKKKAAEAGSPPGVGPSPEAAPGPESSPDDGEAIEKHYHGEMWADGATSFAELDAMRQAREMSIRTFDLADDFYSLVSNIMHNPMVEDKGAAIKALAGEFADRIEDATEVKEHDAPPPPKSLLDRVKALFGYDPTPTFVAPDGTEVKGESGFFVWKEAEDGPYRWFSIYSNHFEDLEKEILSEKAHQAFIGAVEAGIVPHPELWHWHVPGTRWGVADWLAYADGFALASGLVDKGHEAEAEALSGRSDIRTSHGMPVWSVVRNPENPRVIDFYISKEISDLPAHKAANPLTEFVILKEEATMLPDQKKAYLKSVGLADEVIEQIERNLAAKAKEAEEAGLASKEGEPEAEEAAATETGVRESQSVKDQAEGAAAAEAEAITPAILADAIAGVVNPLAEALTEMRGQLEALNLEVKALKATDEEKVATKAAGTPAASIQALLAERLSPIGNEAARVDGRSTLAKDGPQETHARGAAAGPTPFPLINQLVQASHHPARQ